MRKPKKNTFVIMPDELQKILNAMLTRRTGKHKKLLTEYQKFARIRDCMAVYMLYITGCRPMEVYNSRLDYLDIEKNKFFIPAENNKQRHADYIDLPNFLMDSLYEYMQIRAKLFKDNDYLFPAKNGRPDRSVLIRSFRNACRDAGILKASYTDGQGNPRYNYSLYTLRHSYGTLCYSRLKDLRKVAVMLRHRDWQCRSVLRYVHTAEMFNMKDYLKIIFPVEKKEAKLDGPGRA